MQNLLGLQKLNGGAPLEDKRVGRRGKDTHGYKFLLGLLEQKSRGIGFFIMKKMS
jgi:hypothetical protein